MRGVLHRVSTPLGVHLLTLVAAAVFLTLLGSQQWFWMDEFAFIKTEAPHILWGNLGHLSIAPWIMYRALLPVFGLDAYLPYVTFAIAAHLAAAHLLWRLIRRWGAWRATLLVGVFLVMTPAAENVLWAFQMAFVGSLALGLGAILMVDRPRPRWARVIGAILLLLAGLAFSGPAIPMVLAAALIVLHRAGWIKALVVVLSTAIPWLMWYLAFSRLGDRPPTYGATSPADLPRVLEMASLMPIEAVEQILPVKFLGAAVLTAWLVWLVMRAAQFRADRFAAIALVASGAMFALMTSISRLNFGVESAGAGRYVYAIAVFLLPSVALGISEIHLDRIGRVAGATFMVATIAVNAVGLANAAVDHARRASAIPSTWSAAVDLYRRHPDSVATTTWVPPGDGVQFVTITDLIELVESGLFSPVAYTYAESEVARTTLTTR